MQSRADLSPFWMRRAERLLLVGGQKRYLLYVPKIRLENVFGCYGSVSRDGTGALRAAARPGVNVCNVSATRFARIPFKAL